MNIKHLYSIFYILEDLYKNFRIELNYYNNFQLLIAIILSSKTTDKIVNKVTNKIFFEYKTPESIIIMGESKFKICIKEAGLYNIKAKNIIKICNIIITCFNSNIPDNFNDLIKLPGVGRKTANLILNEAFGYSTVAVDSHIFRVSNRIGISTSNTMLGVEKDILKIVPKIFLKNTHNLLLNFGKNICQAKKPKCSICKIQNFCKNKL